MHGEALHCLKIYGKDTALWRCLRFRDPVKEPSFADASVRCSSVIVHRQELIKDD